MCGVFRFKEGDVGRFVLTVRGVQLVTSLEVVAEFKTPGGMKKLPRYKAETDDGVLQKLGR